MSAALDEPFDRPVPAVLGLGGNLGDRAATLAAAVAELGATPGIEVRVVSPTVETEPVGGPEQPDYLNAVVLARVTLSPRQLLRACLAVEAAHGRRRTVRWGPRTLDVDVIDVAGIVADDPELTLPHPRAAGRRFVLEPWLAADPAAVLGGRPVAELLAELPAKLPRRADPVTAAAPAEPPR